MVLYHIHSCMSEKLYIFNKHISKVCFVRILNHVRVVTKYILSRLIPRFDLKF